MLTQTHRREIATNADAVVQLEIADQKRTRDSSSDEFDAKSCQAFLTYSMLRQHLQNTCTVRRPRRREEVQVNDGYIDYILAQHAKCVATTSTLRPSCLFSLPLHTLSRLSYTPTFWFKTYLRL